MDWSKGDGDKKDVWGEQETMMILGEGKVEAESHWVDQLVI